MSFKLLFLALLIAMIPGSMANPWDVPCSGNADAGNEEYFTVYTTVSGMNNIKEVNPQWSEYSEGNGYICDASQIATSGNVDYWVNMSGLYPSHWTFDWDCGGCYHDITGIPIGQSVSYDKTEYTPGDTAHITVSFNSANFNKSKYLYEFIIADPVTGYSEYYELTLPSMQISYLIENAGTYTTSYHIADRNDLDSGFLVDHTYFMASNDNLVSFISWNPHTFDVGSSGKISWGISSSFSDYYNEYSIEIWKDGVEVYTYEDIDNIGSVYYSFTKIGTYEAKLIKTNVLSTVLNTDAATVKTPASTIDTPKTEYNTSETIKLSGHKYPGLNEKDYYYVVVSHFQSLDSVKSDKVYGTYPYDFDLSYNLPVGRYTGSLYGVYDLNDCKVLDNPSVCYILKDYVNFDVVLPVNQSTGKQDLSIAWKESQYKLWDSASLSYQNTTTSDKVIVYDNLGDIVTQFMTTERPLSSTVQIGMDPKYIGTWTAKIIDSSNLNNYKIATMQVISASQQNFSNPYGITMNWDTKEGLSGYHTLTWNTGTYSGNYTIKIIDGVSGLFILESPYKTNEIKAQQYQYKFNDVEKSYTAQFIEQDGTILAAASLDIVKSGGAPSQNNNEESWTNPLKPENDVSLTDAIFGDMEFNLLFFGVLIATAISVIITKNAIVGTFVMLLGSIGMWALQQGNKYFIMLSFICFVVAALIG